MRIRQVKPEFWKDVTMAELSPIARLTYVGLWMLADDAGWFRLDLPSIGLELYGYETRTRREKIVTGAIDILVTAGRVVRYDCGHAQVPTLVGHQRFAGETKRVYTIKKEHADCPRFPAGVGGDDPETPIPAHPRGSPHIPATVRNGRGTGNVSFRKGQSNERKRDDESESEFRLRVGVPAFMGGDV